MNRRTLLKSSLAAPAAAAGLSRVPALAGEPVGPDYKIKNGRIKQSVMGWCFKPDIQNDELARHCAAMGLHAMEGVSRDTYPLIRKLGMEISLVGSHGFGKGPSDKANHDMCREKLIDAIDTAVKFGAQRVITFTGMRVDGLDDKTMAKNCVDLWKSVMPHAEKNNILVCLEHLNTRDDSHPMKGHPGYFGDDVDFCVELIEQVGSDHMKLLFDIYHVQIMNGDVIRRLRQYKDVIGHIHTAGNPGRCEIDEQQEINYPPIMQTLLDIGYDGYVAQEFIPTWEDKIGALRHGVQVCDV